MIASITAPDLKTALAKLAELLQKDPDCVVFCGDRYTLLVEQAACRGGGTFSTSVLTFARYLRGYVSGRMLSKQGSVMVIRRLLNEYRGQLVCFGGHVSGGAAAGIYDTITRLSASKVTPEMLEEADCRDNDVLQRKIADIAFLQHKYEEFLAEHGYADESNYFRLLPKIVREGGLRDKHVVLFGFPSFAAQMREGIRACMDCSRRTTAFFIGGEEELYRNEAEAAFCELAEGHEVKRYRLSARENEDAAHLRRGMFRPESFSEPPKKTDAVRLYEAEDMREEAEFIAACIAREVRQGRRYRDAAVLVPSVEEYALTVQTVFREFGISAQPLSSLLPRGRRGRLCARFRAGASLERLLRGVRQLSQLSHQVRGISRRRAAGDTRRHRIQCGADELLPRKTALSRPPRPRGGAGVS